MEEHVRVTGALPQRADFVQHTPQALRSIIGDVVQVSVGRNVLQEFEYLLMSRSVCLLIVEAILS